MLFDARSFLDKFQFVSFSLPPLPAGQKNAKGDSKNPCVAGRIRV